jgi:predicted HicB family RNase H-like nuclease
MTTKNTAVEAAPVQPKKRIGRPPATGTTRSVRFELRMTPSEMQAVHTHAASEGVSLAEYVRRRLVTSA